MEDPKIFVTSVGCSIYMSRVKKYLQLNDYQVVNNIKDADICILGTCVALESTERLNFRAARELLKAHPGVRLIFAGCGPRALPDHFDGWESFLGYEGVEAVFPPRKLPYSKVSFEGEPEVEQALSLSEDVDAQAFDTRHFVIQDVLGRLGPPFLDKFQNHKYTDGVSFREDTSYAIVISEGCKFRCSYCIEWKAQPPYRSFPKEDIFSQIEKAHARGHRRFSIVCNDLASYGTDIYGEYTLKEFLDELFQRFPGSKFGIRYMSPVAVQKVFPTADLKLYADRLFFLRVSIESASQHILKRMNRPRNLGEAKKLLKRFREHYDGLMVTELIYGFPGETEEDIRETARYMIDAGFDDFNLTEFSPRPGTPLEDEKPCRDAEKHMAILEDARKHLLIRHIRRTLLSLLDFATKTGELRFRKDALPDRLADHLRTLDWSGWQDDSHVLFAHPEFPDFEARLHGSTLAFRLKRDGGWEEFSIILKEGEREHVINSLKDIFGGAVAVSRRRRSATCEGLQFFAEKLPDRDFLKIVGDTAALKSFMDSLGELNVH